MKAFWIAARRLLTLRAAALRRSALSFEKAGWRGQRRCCFDRRPTEVRRARRRQLCAALVPSVGGRAGRASLASVEAVWCGHRLGPRHARRSGNAPVTTERGRGAAIPTARPDPNRRTSPGCGRGSHGLSGAGTAASGGPAGALLHIVPRAAMRVPNPGVGTPSRTLGISLPKPLPKPPFWPVLRGEKTKLSIRADLARLRRCTSRPSLERRSKCGLRSFPVPSGALPCRGIDCLAMDCPVPFGRPDLMERCTKPAGLGPMHDRAIVPVDRSFVTAAKSASERTTSDCGAPG